MVMALGSCEVALSVVIEYSSSKETHNVRDQSPTCLKICSFTSIGAILQTLLGPCAHMDNACVKVYLVHTYYYTCDVHKLVLLD